MSTLPKRRERLAVNVADLTRLDSTIRSLLLGGNLDLTQSIRTDPDRIDEGAVAFSCDLLTAACIADTIREHNRRAGEYPTRIYLRRGAAWTKLPGQTVLTRVVGDSVVLDHDTFPPDVHPSDLAIPTPTAVMM